MGGKDTYSEIVCEQQWLRITGKDMTRLAGAKYSA